MSTVLQKLLKERKSDSLQDEIRRRVLARYSEMQGLENEKSELEATLEALQEMTGLPRHDIDSIALAVQEKYAYKTDSSVKENHLPELNFTEPGLVLDQENEKLRLARRGFMYHLVPYVMVNTSLIILNAITTSFPWAMFPVFFWGIGVVSHFLGTVYWPEKDWKRKITTIKQLIHQILSENSQSYLKEGRSEVFMGIFRLTLIKSNQATLEEYLKNADPTLDDNRVKQISIQLVAIQNQYLPAKRQNNKTRP